MCRSPSRWWKMRGDSWKHGAAHRIVSSSKFRVSGCQNWGRKLETRNCVAQTRNQIDRREIFMCDFAADAKAAEELMVGRTLSVARVRELNAKDYFYQMLKDNPEMLKIYPGIENELLQGAIDCHIHAFPDFVHRSQDMIQIAIEASKCGMRAIAFKDHWNISATSAYLTQRHIDDMIARGELTNRVEVYGGVGMCFGMRPDYVRVGLQYPNFKMI